MKYTSLSQLPNVRVLGRHAEKREPHTLFYTASGFACIFTGSELRLRLEADYAQFEPWISVELNGAQIMRCPVAKGESEIVLIKSMTEGTPKFIRVLKEVQAMHYDPMHKLQIAGLGYESGEFLPLSAPTYKLEFIGDSITSGEGTEGAVSEQDWISAFFSAYHNYSRMTADALNADWRVISQSGWGVLSGWDNDPYNIIPPYYTQVCGIADGEMNEALGAQDPNNFAAWRPDAIIINLCTNDAGAMHNEPWTDPKTGRKYAQRDTAALADAVVKFLAELRRCNPHAKLVWAYGMLGHELCLLLEQAVAKYRKEYNDENAYFLTLPDTKPNELGAREHPGIPAHKHASEALTAFLKEIL